MFVEPSGYLNEFADRVKAAGAPLDFIAASEYSKWDANGFAPSQPMAGTIEVLGEVARQATGVATTPVEVHEWGWATWGKWDQAEFGAKAPMGVYGGAWDLGSYLYQRVGGASRVFHWGESHDNSLNRGVKGRGGNASQTCVPGTEYGQDCRLYGYPLVSAHGWLLTALLHLQPQDAAPSLELAEMVTDIPLSVTHPTHRHRGYNHTVGAVRARDVSAGRLTYLVLNFSPNFTEHHQRSFKLEVSAADVAALLAPEHGAARGCAALTVTQMPLNRTTSTHDLIEAKLFESGLKVRSELRSVDTVSNMATADGLKMLTSDAASWMDLNRQSLRFSAYDGAIGEGDAGGCTLAFELTTPAMVLLRIEKPPSFA